MVTIIYQSTPSFRSLWATYSLYQDRLVLPCNVLFTTFVVPLEEIDVIEVRPPVVIADLFRRQSFAEAFTLKLDLADLSRHVHLKRKKGLFHHLRFTPDQPERFVDAVVAHMRECGLHQHDPS